VSSRQSERRLIRGIAVVVELTIPFGFAELRLLQDVIEAALRGVSLSDRDIFSVKLSVEEALVNAIKNGTSIRPALEIAINAVKRAG
jgi:serine/threonine-protein kinase RsbW